MWLLKFLALTYVITRPGFGVMMPRFGIAATLLAIVCLLNVALPHLSAQQSAESAKPTSFWPDGVEFDESIPTPKQFLGFDIGFRHMTHAQVAGYVKKLAEVSDRITIEQYAQTHGGRPLLLLTITSKENRERLDEIKSKHRRLTKPNSAKIDTTNLPAVINMGYGVHGDEPSGTNCAPLVAYYLAAAKGEEIEKWLNDCVILLDPSLNPDGFNRFANWANRYRGRVLNPDPQHAEHNQMWPPGRVNYYWFDLNRDWLPLVHPESQGRMKWYHQWKPNVVLDFHEMGTNSSYFFQPGIPKRTNPLTPRRNQELTRKFGSYHAKALDKRGSLYFTQERFDDFYMGKGSTYPDLHGCVGILFEQASSRGHAQRNQDGILRFHETIANHFATSLSSLRATSAMRDELVDFKRSFYQQSLKQAKKQKIQTFVFSCPNNLTRLEKFARTLRKHDIQCYSLKEDLEHGDQSFSKSSTLIVPVDQPEYRFLRSLLMRRTDFKENIFYDVSSWTLNLAHGITQTGLTRKLDPELLDSDLFADLKKHEPLEFDDSDVAYLIDFRDDRAAHTLGRLLSAGVKVRVAKKPMAMTVDGKKKSFGYGTLSVVVGTQKGKVKVIRQVLSFAKQAGATITPVKTGLSASGPDLGSGNFPVLKKPNIAMITGGQASPYSAGQIWHLLDTEVNLPVTMLKADRFSRANLDEYTTLLIPEGRIDSDHWSKIKSFADGGGTVVAVGNAAASTQSKLSGSQTAAIPTEADGSIQKPFDSASNERALKLISGAIFKTKVDLTHPLLYGFNRKELAVFRSHSQFLKPSKNPYCNPVIYDTDAPLMAGYCSDENVERFKGSASVVVVPSGRGQFVLMADNPNFRGFWKSTSRLFLNAIYFGDLVKP